MGSWVHRHPQFWLGLGRLESHLLADRLAAISFTRPVFVCGLARSGSTLLHEIVASHPDFASHRVKDYPMVFTPYWWRRAIRHRRATPPRERAHGDRVFITPDSPDALEEMVWMAFFPRCHDPSVSNLLGASVREPAFAAFYRSHLRKLLLAEGAARYVAKANYHVARMPYLLRLFPDARFIIPVRDPVSHIASLIRQQQRFTAGERRHPRALAYMRQSGHYEFGLDRRPMNLGNTTRVKEIERAWSAGEEVRGWALYWASVHEHLAQQVASDDALRSAAIIVPFEEMCAAPAATLGKLFHHCAIPGADSLIERLAPNIRRPDYYTTDLTAEEVATIRQTTAGSASRWGY
jgi:hypothetical protein